MLPSSFVSHLIQGTSHLLSLCPGHRHPAQRGRHHIADRVLAGLGDEVTGGDSKVALDNLVLR